MVPTFYVFLVNFDNMSSQPEHYSYNDSALWSLEATLAPVPLNTARPSTLAQRFAATRQRGEVVHIEVVGGARWTVRLRAVGTHWLSAETEADEPRGVIISYHAMTVVKGLSAGDAPDAPVVGVSMFQAVAESIRHNPRVALGAGAHQYVGVVTHIAEDYLELLPRPGLGVLHRGSARWGPAGEGGPPAEGLVIPLAGVDYLSFLEPGDSF